MSTGLLALLDDVAVLARTAAASLDDIAAASLKAGTQSTSLIIDDAAVTPKYVLGFAAERELPIVKKITIGSLKNKLLFLLPAALALSFFAPWVITPLLMLGGLYLSYEGAEKIYGALTGHGHGAKLKAQNEGEAVRSAIRTDFILSAEIMALTLSSVAHMDLALQAVVLGLVGIFITFLVYGSVALIVRADDFGLAMAANYPGTLRAKLGKGIVKGMPSVLKTLSVVGTAAMLWVGGGILIHGLHEYHISQPEQAMEAAAHAFASAPVLPGLLSWAAGAVVSGLLGLAAGAVIALGVSTVRRGRTKQA
jgi:uncharacterized protein